LSFDIHDPAAHMRDARVAITHIVLELPKFISGVWCRQL
jgi:hypothetical protein